MASKIKENRMKKFQELLKTRGEARLYSQDGKEFGFFLNEVEPYRGEAGFSTRHRVLWSDGSTTLCATKGMGKFRKVHHKII